MAENGNGKRASLELPEDLRSSSARAARSTALLDAPRSKHAGWLWIVWIVVILAVGAAAYIYLPKIISRQSEASGAASAKANNRPAPVTIATAKLGEMPLYLNGLGTVTALNSVTVRTRVTGQIMKVGYKEGQHVIAGKTLVAEIDPRPYQAALDQAKGQLTKDQAFLANAQLNVTRDENAMKTSPGAVSQQQYDTDKSTVSQYFGIVQSDQAAIEADQVQLDYCTINAPLSGVIGLRLVDEGNIVQPTDANGLAVINQLQPISVIFTLSEDVLPQVLKRQKTGQPIEVDAYDRDMTDLIAKGKLLAIDSSINSSTGTIQLKAIFDNDDGMLYPNQFVNARLLIDTRTNSVIVPSAAVQRGPNSTYIYVMNPDDNTVKMQNVTVGPSENDQTIIESGVWAGQKVVTDGVDNLTDGKKVQPVEMSTKSHATTEPGATTEPAAQHGAAQPGTPGYMSGADSQAPGTAADQPAAGAGGEAGVSAAASSQPTGDEGSPAAAGGHHHHHRADATTQPADGGSDSQ